MTLNEAAKVRDIITEQLQRLADLPAERARLVLQLPYWSLMSDQVGEWLVAHGTKAERDYRDTTLAFVAATRANRMRAAEAQLIAERELRMTCRPAAVEAQP